MPRRRRPGPRDPRFQACDEVSLVPRYTFQRTRVSMSTAITDRCIEVNVNDSSSATAAVGARPRLRQQSSGLLTLMSLEY